MNTYEKPEFKITKFEIEDVITTSVITPDIDGGSAAFPEGWEQPTAKTAASLLGE